MLQTDWLIWRLRPNAVSLGSSAIQFDCSPQSPQPFADFFADQVALRDIGILAPLAQAFALGGTGLFVDDHRHAGMGADIALHGIELVAMMKCGDRGIVRALPMARQILGHQRNALHAFGMDLAGDIRRGDAAVETLPLDRLTTGHRDRAVDQDLVGDVAAGRDIGADREQPGMKIRAVAEILEYVLTLHERRLPDPRRPLAAHVVHADGPAIGQPRRQSVTADTAHRNRTLRYVGRGIVRTPGAETRQAHQRALPAAKTGLLHRLLQCVQRFCEPRIRYQLQQLSADDSCQQHRVQFTPGRDQRRTRRCRACR